MEDLFRTLPKLLKEMGEHEEVRDAVVFAAWRKVAGASLQSHAVAFRLYNKHLMVAVTSETWKKHLEFLSGQMIFKINSVLGQAIVTFIEFRVDEATVAQERRKIEGSTMSDQELREVALEEVTPKMRRAADAIKDDNLRYQFLIAAGGALAHKKRRAEKAKEDSQE